MARQTFGVRDLRNKGGDVLQRVQAGEQSVVVTKSGKPMAELRPIQHMALSREVLLSRWRALPKVDLAGLRADLAPILDDNL